MTDHIVVGIDDSSGARKALRWAIDHTNAVEGRLTVIYAFEPSSSWADAGSAEKAKIQADDERRHRYVAKQILEDVVDEKEEHLLTVEAIGADGAQALLDASDDADLLVVGSRGRGSLTGALLGSVSQRCAQHSRCPVVIVPDALTATSISH